MPEGNKTTTTVQNSDPWEGAQPNLKYGLEQSKQLYEQGSGFNPYPNPTYVPFSGQTQQALSGIEGLANAGSPIFGLANNQAQNVLASGGMTPWQQSALAGTHDVATGANRIGLGNEYQGLLAQAGQPGAIDQYLRPTAAGDYLASGNPHFNQVLDTQAAKLTDDINRSFSNSGRYGSAAHANAAAEGVGNFRNQAMMQQWEAERARQMQAAGMLSQEQGQGIGQQLSVLGGLGGVRGADIANQVAAGQTAFGAGNTAASQAAQWAQMAPGLYESQYQPLERLASVGSVYEGQSQMELQDAINRWTQEQQAPLDRLAYFNAIASGAGSLGGTSTTSAMVPRNYAAPLGGALGGAQIGASIPGVGIPGALIGGLGGAGLGLASMFL